MQQCVSSSRHFGIAAIVLLAIWNIFAEFTAVDCFSRRNEYCFKKIESKTRAQPKRYEDLCITSLSKQLCH